MSKIERRAGVPLLPDEPGHFPNSPLPQRPMVPENDPLQMPWNDPEIPGKLGIPREQPQPIVVPTEPS
jgi:hypothetical protein